MDVEFAGESKKEVQAELKELRLTLCALEELVEHFAERLLPVLRVTSLNHDYGLASFVEVKNLLVELKTLEEAGDCLYIRLKWILGELQI